MATADPAADLHVTGTVAAPTHGRDDELPDPALFWRWVARATRPVWGWVLVGAGLVAPPGGHGSPGAACWRMGGKSGAGRVTAATARRRGLKPCRLCEPVTAEA